MKLSTAPRRRHIRKMCLFGLVLLGLFVAANLGIYAAYRQRLYPNTVVGGQRLGSVKASDLPARLPDLNLLPGTMQLVYQDKSTEASPGDLGLAIDYQKTADLAKQQKSWLPILNLARDHVIPLQLRIDTKTLDTKAADLIETYTQEPVDAHIARQDGIFFIEDATPGYRLRTNALPDILRSGLEHGNQHIELPTQPVDPEVKPEDLLPALQTIQAQQNTLIRYTFESKSKTFTPQEIGEWFTKSNNTYVLSDDKIKAAVAETGKTFGVNVHNTSQAAAAARSALEKNQSLDFALKAVPRPHKTFTYCTKLRGLDASLLSDFTAKVGSVLNDKRGWSLDGQITYTNAESGCDFTVWLVSPERMGEFGAICDGYWNCQIGDNVVANFDRWIGATPPWNQEGRNIDDYQTMLINHEGGHWLGFGHRGCTGAGDPAPVMLQQSMNLQGCIFNEWPVQAELDTLRARLRL